MMNSEVERSGVFQFTHPGGVRLELVTLVQSFEEFQFTHPGGVRLKICHTGQN